MTANFFHSLNERRVEYLLISGQATVLYGAATFSEDIDLWINPTQENSVRFIAALRECQARYYKLTPEFTVTNLNEGHGFHFIIPDGTNPEVFLDVMGNPPRAGRFHAAAETAHWMETPWGNVRTIGIKPLVELKKTQRLEDYPVISKLVLAWFDQPESARSPQDFAWAMENFFTIPEFTRFILEHQKVTLEMRNRLPLPKVESAFIDETLSGGGVSEVAERELGEWMQTRILEYQHADRQYWRRIISSLRVLRTEGKLTTEGTVV